MEIMHVYKYMQIQIAFRHYKEPKLSSFTCISLLLFFVEIACYDFYDFHIRI